MRIEEMTDEELEEHMEELHNKIIIRLNKLKQEWISAKNVPEICNFIINYQNINISKSIGNKR